MYFVGETADGGWDRSSWMENAKPAIKNANALANLPYVKTEDGTVITQSNACLSFLARRWKLMGGNEKQVSETEQLMCQVMDLRNSAVGEYTIITHPRRRSVPSVNVSVWRSWVWVFLACVSVT